MARMDDDAQQPVSRCGTSAGGSSLIRQDHVIDLTVKHIDIRKHFAHEAIQNRHMRIIKVGTDYQMADILTKALPFPAFMRCVEGVMRGAMAPKVP